MNARQSFLLPPRRAVSRLVSGALVVVWAIVRLGVFREFIFPLTYALPLLVGLWTCDTAAVWGMALTFAVLQTVHQLWILPAGALAPHVQAATLAATYINIGVTATVVHGAIVLRRRLDVALHTVRTQAATLEVQAAALAQQNRDLLEQAKLMAARNDEIRRHAALIDLTPDAIIIRRFDGTIIDWSRGAEALYGWSAAEAAGQHTHSLLRTVFPEPRADIEARFARDGEWTGELVHFDRHGRSIAVQSRWRLSHGAEGGDDLVLESNVDITGQKAAENTLRDVDRRKTEFLATLSHELRNPLAPMRFALGLLERVEHPQVERPRAVLERQLTHLVRLLDDLLDLTRIARNKVQLKIARVDIADVMEQALEAVQPELARQRHTCTVDYPASPLWVDGDRERLAQVITNLLTNAARYTPPGGAITMSGARHGSMAEVSVRDTGIGLRAEDLQAVFEMFAQVGEPGAGGLGIGLAVVKRIVDLHGGVVEARSDGPGRGSTFVVRLPAAASAETSTGPEPRAVDAVAPRKVLVVEDNHDGAAMLQILLELDGHIVQIAHDGASALKILESFTPDVALLDIGLPDMTGYDLARAIRASPVAQHTFLAALSGWGQDDDRRRAREAGFNAHLVKPADLDRVRQIVASASDVRA